MSVTQPYVPRARERSTGGPLVKRSRSEHLRIWWREVDRVLLGLVLLLVALGTVAVAAASPASARRLSTEGVRLDDLHFYWLHLRFLFLGLAAMFAVSMAPKELARRGAVIAGGVLLAALMLVPLVGYEVNGAKRWINLGMSFQPSEFLKPAFAVTLAWIISWRARDPALPVIPIASALMVLVAGLLMAQPDFGSTMLYVGTWFALVLLSGIDLRRIGILSGAVVAALIATYILYDNARHRIDAFLGGGTAYDQVDLASRALTAGGWTGTGLWLGTRKLSLPEAHTDYIFSVVGEEFGLLACAVIMLLYIGIVVRVLVRMAEEEDLFTILAATGLTVLVGGQAFINILVNLRLFPSKGMTLPLVSYGGSSTIAVCLSIGLLLALTRRNPYLGRDGLGWVVELARKRKGGA